MTTPALRGLGMTLEDLRAIVAGDARATDAIDRVTLRHDGNPTGANQHGTVDNVNSSSALAVERPTGNSSRAALRGLGMSLADLSDIVKGCTLAEDAIARVTKRGPGAPEGNKNAAKETTVNNINNCLEAVERPTGNSSRAALRGLGMSLKDLRDIVKGDVKALDALDRVTVRPAGGDQRSEAARTNVDNVHVERPQGNAKARALRKLRADRPDLHQQVLAGQLSAHAAMLQAGFRKPSKQYRRQGSM